jgi:bacterioferritin-associated ferredoxin
MYVCNCNGVRCGEVDQAIRRGARTPKQVLAQHGHEPQCCRCLKEIAGRIKEARSQPEAGFARVVVE